MSITNKLNKLAETKAAIKQAIIDKGVDVSDDTKFADYPSKIAAIESGGSSDGSGDDSYYENLFLATTADNTNYSYLFAYSNRTTIDVSRLDTSNVTIMVYMFYSCNNLTSLDLSHFDTRNVTRMNSMFGHCSALTELNLSNWNTSKVTDMSSMFYGCSNLTSLDLSNFDTSNVTSIDSMFCNCNSLTSIDVSHFDFSKIKDISSVFYSCRALTSLDVSSWDISKITGNYDIGGAFNYCTSLVDFYPPQNISAPMEVSRSTALSHDSLVRIIDNLITVTSTKKLTLGADNLAKLTDEEKAIATNKGWTLA